jgi:two-component system, LuxR family, sensor kinase FixL
MNWVTFIWALVIGASVVMALPHLFVGLKDRTWKNLLFAISAFGVAGVALGELAIMHAGTPQQIGQRIQWTHFPLFFMTLGIVGFVRAYFGTGRLWLLIVIGAVRSFMLVINFAFPPNVNFRAITGLRRFEFLGDTVSMPAGIIGWGTPLGQVSSILILVFVIDATVMLWRRGNPDARRRAIVVGGSITLFILLSAGLAALTHANLVLLPYLISFPFLGVIVAMGFELSYDLLRADKTVQQLRASEAALRESEGRFRTVADVAPVMIWMSDTEKRGVFFNKGWLEFTGRPVDQELGTGWLGGIHPEDLAHTQDVCGSAFAKREPFTVEYRLRRKDDAYRWLLDTGTARFESDGTFLGYIGSCIDITERRQAELDHQLQSTELARVGRVALMGELAASLAHEVNNPLGAMVTNASAGQRMLAKGQLEPAELQELLADIIADGHRAREVIEGIRNMVRKSEASHSLVGMQDVIRDLLRIVRADAIARNVSLVAEVDENAGTVLADRVQLLQVLLNLTLNAFEALSVIRPDIRRVVIRAEPVQGEKICVSVRDTGPGFPDGLTDQLFEPFFSTKAEGTGMGLAIARSIVEGHGGTLAGKNCADGGALFTICLPDATEAKSQAA